MKKLLAISLLCFSVLLTAPSDGFSRDRGYGGHDGYRDGGRYYSGHRGHYGGGYYGHHHNDDIFWGVTGFLFGTALGAAIYQPPVYSYGPPVYYTAPPPPPMCRYERYVTDRWGRTYLEYHLEVRTSDGRLVTTYTDTIVLKYEPDGEEGP